MSDFAPNDGMNMNYNNNNNINNHHNNMNTNNYKYNNHAYQGFYSQDERSQSFEQQQSGCSGESEMQRELMAPLAHTGMGGMDGHYNGNGHHNDHGHLDGQNLQTQTSAQSQRQTPIQEQGLGNSGLLDRADSSGALSTSSNDSTGIVRNLRKSVTSWFYPDAHDA